MLRKIILLLLIALVALYYTGYTPDDVKTVKNLYNAYNTYKTIDTNNNEELKSIASSFNRAVIVSDSSTAYMIYSSETYFAIKSETTYIITNDIALIIYNTDGTRVTSITKLPRNFREMNIVDQLVTQLYDNPAATTIDCTTPMFFINECPTSVTYTITGNHIIFFLNSDITISLYPAESS